MPASNYQIDSASVRPVISTLKAIPLAEAPDGLFQQIMGAKLDMLEREYTTLPDTDSNPTYADYASVVVNGEVVARLDNHGWLITSNARADDFDAMVDEADSTSTVSSGPLLAQARAEKIAAAMNGSIVKASTAMTQKAYQARPQPRAIVNVDAMKQDSRYAELEKLRTAHSAFLALQIAQEACRT